MASPAPPKLLPSRIVSHVLDVPQSTLNTWAATGVLDVLGIPPTTAGKSRAYTLNDVFRLALVKAFAVVTSPSTAAYRLVALLDGIDFEDIADIKKVAKSGIKWVLVKQEGREYEHICLAGEVIADTVLLCFTVNTEYLIQNLADEITDFINGLMSMNRKAVRKWMAAN